MDRLDEILQKAELDLIEFTSSDINEKKSKLPLLEKKQIKSLIWNLFVSNRYKHDLSYNDCSEILERLFERLKK